MAKTYTFQKPIAEEMKSFEGAFRKAFSTRVALLNIVLRYVVRQKGKRLRPMLVYLVSQALGQGRSNDRSTRAAVLVELMHTATLVHDDVVDEAPTRRGAFSIQALWRKKVAVLVGDYMLSRVLLLAVEHEDYDLLMHVSKAVQAMSEGELLQIEKARRLDIDEAVYYDVIQQKTASLMAACCAAGAASVDASEEHVEQARKFGEYLGMAFQIQDDILDYSAFAKTGKPTGIDVREQKMTLPLIYALQQASPREKKEMMRIVRHKQNDPESVEQLMRQVVDMGGIDYAQKAMKGWQDKASDILQGWPGGAARDALSELLTYIGQRAK